ncbi:CHASE domain-containing protein [Pseudidiomarina aquimaris]|uniref:CHASE domain-containing protein n=1 Tax=Pseudidiomarina aquimaris TaxID=641841 RepID=UPI003A97F746
MKKTKWVPGLAFLVGVVISAGASYLSFISEVDRAKESFFFNIEQVEVAVTERLRTYELMLRGAAGFYETTSEIDRNAWRAYTEKLRQDGLISEVQGIGFAIYLEPQEVDAFNRRMRAEGFPDFRLHPVTPREKYSSILYLEPFDERNQRAFGYDMYSESTRRDAMHRAATTKQAALSGPVELLQEMGTEKQVGTLMYVPVFDLTRVVDKSDPYDALLGWAYSPFRMTDLIDGIIQNWIKEDGASITLAIYDGGTLSDGTLIYQSKQLAESVPKYLAASVPFSFGGRSWLLEFKHRNEYAALNMQRPMLFFLLGLLISGVLAAYLRALQLTRDRATRLAEHLTHELRTKQNKMVELSERWRYAVQATQGGVWDWRTGDNHVYFSDEWYKIFGFTPAKKHQHSTWLDNIHPDDYAGLMERLNRFMEHSRPGEDTFENEYRMLGVHGNAIWILDRGFVVERDSSGKPSRIIGTVEDITAEHDRMHQLQSAAETDRLTGLPNRAYLYKYLRKAIKLQSKKASMLAVMFVDLDRFKHVNDTFGHDVGDALLIEVASRFRDLLRANDVLCRWGGDEFLVVLDTESMETITDVATRLIEAASTPVYINERELLIGASIGATVYHGSVDTTAEELIRSADKLMYDVKLAQRGQYKLAEIDEAEARL